MKCPRCNHEMVFWHGCGWYYDKWICPAPVDPDAYISRRCPGEIILDVSTYPGEEDKQMQTPETKIPLEKLFYAVHKIGCQYQTLDDSILVEIERPEGYEDVDAEILAADALRHWVRYKVINKEEEIK